MELNIELPRVSSKFIGGWILSYQGSPVGPLEVNIELPRVLGGSLKLNIELL